MGINNTSLNSVLFHEAASIQDSHYNFGNITIAVIGLGLIGGSLAKAFREKLEIKNISAFDPNPAFVSQALNEGVISSGCSELDENIFYADIIFVCTPVSKAAQYIDILAGRVKTGCIITDVGSTKESIIKHVDGLPSPPCFIGGHPMSGGEKSGYPASIPHLFENAYYILTPSKSSSDSSMKLLSGLISGIGGLPVVIEAGEHDRVTAAISHVPHIIASALVNLVRECDSPEKTMQMLAAGGFKDITRIASSSPDMWENIVLKNKQHIEEILDRYLDILKRFRSSMLLDDSMDIYGFFESAKTYRDSFGEGNRGLITPVFDIIVDVKDQPGIIGEIASILGNGGVNIKNINVSNSREFEQGCLKITLPDQESVNISFDLLRSGGYKVYKSGN